MTYTFVFHIADECSNHQICLLGLCFSLWKKVKEKANLL